MLKNHHMVAKRSYDVNGISLQSCLLLSELQPGICGLSE